MDQAFRGARAGNPDPLAEFGEVWNTRTQITASRLKTAGVFKTPRPSNRNDTSYFDEATRAASRKLRNARRMEALHDAYSRVSHDETPPRDEPLYGFDQPRNLINGDFLSRVIDAARYMDIGNGLMNRPQCTLAYASDPDDGLHFGPTVRVLPVRSRYGDNLDQHTGPTDAMLPRYPLYGFGPDIVQQNDFCYRKLCDGNGHYLTAVTDAGILNVKLMRADAKTAYEEFASLRFVELNTLATATRLAVSCGTRLYKGAIDSVVRRKRFGCVVCATVKDGLTAFAHHLTLLGFDVLYAQNVFLWPSDCSRHVLFTDDPSFLDCTSCPVIVDPGEGTIPIGVPYTPTLHNWPDVNRQQQFRKWFGTAYIVDCHGERLHDVFHVIHNNDSLVDPVWDLPAPKPPEHAMLR